MMAPTSSSLKKRRNTALTKRHKSFFAGRWHYNPVFEGSNNPQQGREGWQRAHILSRQWLARHDTSNTVRRSMYCTDIDDSNWTFDSNLDDDYNPEDFESLQRPTARQKKNIENRINRKKNWDAILGYIIKALRGQDISNDHTKECCPQPREILFIDCTCKETSLIFYNKFLFVLSNPLLLR
jgi:hypothetical protein